MCTRCQGHVNKKGVPSLFITPWTSPRSDFQYNGHVISKVKIFQGVMPNNPIATCKFYIVRYGIEEAGFKSKCY